MTRWFGKSGITRVRLDVMSTVILWLELFMFAMIYGLAFRSRLVFGIIFLGSTVLMFMPERIVYIIIALSFLWGFIAFSIGFSISWGWATALGMAFFLIGMGSHLTGLKKPVASTVVSANHENNEWRRNGYGGRQNLN